MRLLLAPLQGLTTCTFREVWARHYACLDAALAPFVATAIGVSASSGHFRDILPEKNRALPLIPQVLGNDGPALLATCRAIAGLGYREINWNLGCPFARVTRKRRGCGLLPHTERIVAILEAVLPALLDQGVRLSLKVRLGLTKPTDMEALLPRLDRLEVVSITIHPRTGAQQYTGTVDLNAFERCLGLTRHEVIYNGDVTTTAFYQELRQRFGSRVGTWMIGRGVIADPLLPELIRGTVPDDAAARVARFRAFHDDLFDTYGAIMHGPRHALDKMKGLWFYWARAMAGGDRVLKKVRKVHGPEEYRALVGRVLGGG